MTAELRNKLIAQALVGLSQVAFPLITYPIITHALYAEGLGAVNFADSIVQTVLILASIGIPLYGVREIAIRRQNPSKSSLVFRELISLQLIIALPAVALVWWIGRFSGVNSELLFIGTIALVSSSLGGEWFLQAHESFSFIALRTLVIRIISTLLIYLLVNDAGDGELYYAILTGTVVLTMVLNWMVIIKMLRKSTEKMRPLRHLKKVNWVFGCYALASLYTVMDSLMLGWMVNEETVGHYSFAYKLIRISAMIIPTLGVVFIPRIALHHSEEKQEEIQHHIKNSQNIIYFFCIPMSLLFFVMAPEIVATLANADFLPSVAVLRILSLIPFLTGLTHLTGTQIMVSIHKEKIFFAFLAAGFLIDLGSNFILIPMMKEKGAALSILFTEVFLTVGSLAYLIRLKLFSISVKPFFNSVLASLFLLPVVFLLRRYAMPPVWLLLSAISITAMIYLTFQYFMNRSLIRQGKL